MITASFICDNNRIHASDYYHNLLLTAVGIFKFNCTVGLIVEHHCKYRSIAHCVHSINEEVVCRLTSQVQQWSKRQKCTINIFRATNSCSECSNRLVPKQIIPTFFTLASLFVPFNEPIYVVKYLEPPV